MKNRSIILLLTLLILSTLGYIYTSHHKKSNLNGKEVKAITVETAPVTEKILAEKFETLGSLASTDNIDISSELAGQIAAIYFTPGAYVKKGTLLIQLDDTVLKSELASAKANLTLSETNYIRTKELAKRSLASEQALDKTLADLQEKENTVKVKQAQLEKLSLRAPFSGTLGSRQVSVGQYVKVGQPLVRLVANQKLRVEYNLPERYLPKLHLGQKVTVRSDAFPNKTYIGIVNYIDPAVDKETRTIAVEALIDNVERLLSAGLFVRVNHQFGERKKRLLVPEESLIPTINGQKIFVLRGKKAVAVRVKTGAHHASMTEICSGLNPSDIVIIRGQHKLKEGSRVIDIRKG
ncbi:efflux RND transporter periplasmic adaptor subunit [Legionella micdadei]|uniref:Membrane fusion protein, multidrug efflux system n=1 Tax=Legionella micdadei TaxID=451 RepID=A0A098GK70_LEGMI|nr:efflux RND transporter periplasmic adaptor subunit [Legionella micdadei]ARG96714.1 MexH family multidrug efflux RND transporter periplasmic adaptor subunit [Legionella micdadei]ARG99461.1 MexH family multidrug efflux RND transporter periplasmic adaptor subunit [Legionella micdadei]KTD26379.1 hemolysin D [Legionella micdadei]NSL19045.1 efflux RND transporter periplasmic adaptor subunit [Legionella micdadei]CEG61906.1 putative Efflux transporter, RND family, MFP subunit [Legionella micdadei]